VSEINPEILKKHGLINQTDQKIKILGNGELKKSISVVADSFTAAAIQKIQGAAVHIRSGAAMH
jgi:large subunit ribosomal protein L15